MAYEKIPFVNDGPPAISATNLNHMQTQYEKAMADIEAQMGTPGGTEPNRLTVTDENGRVGAARNVPFTGWRIFTTGGMFTVPEGVTRVFVEVVGGGGKGGEEKGSGGTTPGGGGGGGGYAAKLITGLTPLDTIAVTVGLGAKIGTSAGTSSFGAHCSATGGKDGMSSATGAARPGGKGGNGVGGDINIGGSGGGCSLQSGIGGGLGGGSALGGGGAGTGQAYADCDPDGQDYGGGGAGGGSQISWGTGAPGVVIVRW